MSLTILGIPASLKPSPELINTCRSLKALGFRLAREDFAWKPEFEPLVDLAASLEMRQVSYPGEIYPVVCR